MLGELRPERGSSWSGPSRHLPEPDTLEELTPYSVTEDGEAPS